MSLRTCKQTLINGLENFGNRGKLIIAARRLVFPRAGDWELEHYDKIRLDQNIDL